MKSPDAIADTIGFLRNIRHRSAIALLCVSLFCAIAVFAGSSQPDAITPDGGRYFGQLVDGKLEGKGRVDWEDGTHYEGAFRGGMFEGEGHYVSKYEDYRGGFRKGRYWGKGEIRYKDGRTYRGEFVDGVYQGKGRYETPDGEVYEGSFDNDQLNGKGTLTSKDGKRYEGEFRQWRFHGTGVLHYPNGDQYKGGFANGMFEGKGVFTYAKPRRDGRAIEAGVWHYGRLEDKDAERRMRERAEAALYSQRTMLDAAVAALRPSDSRKINMYFLAVAGDGSQEVFRREVEFVRRQFDTDFQTQGHSLVLANSRETLSTYPMATLTSVRESLGAIARQMNRDKDILFLFLTSHGSRSHEFILNLEGIDLENLQAKELGKLLASSGIRWKVVVVSACYSGGFIDSIKDDRTLVITAARQDRTSFGCADENDFTYFGRAFFEQALPRAKSFEDAFDVAKAIVTKWEDEDIAGSADHGKQGTGKEKDVEHSEPQIYRPAPVAQHLREWRAQLLPRRGDALAKSAADPSPATPAK